MSEEELARARMVAIKAKRTVAKSACTRGQTFVDGIGDREVSHIELRQRQIKFRECWQAFDNAQAEIELFETAAAYEAVHNEERRVFEEKYVAVDTKFEELIIASVERGVPVGARRDGVLAEQQNRDGNHQQRVSMRLPPIELPTFSGLYEEWRPFHDIFQSMIHENVELPDIQKMHYLKAALKGEAAGVISSLDSTAENYAEAWLMLNERYDNQRVLVQKHIKAIFEQPTLQRENCGDLRQLLDSVLKHLRALKVLKRGTDKWDDLMIYVITSKLPPVTNREWENSLKDSNIPTFKQLTEFLAHRCRILEAVERKPQGLTSTAVDKAITKKSISANLVTDRLACSFCRGDHPIFHCDKFRELTIEQRCQEIRALKLCLNCLKSTEHRAKHCTIGRCKKCNKRHNTLLHIDSRQQDRTSEQKSSDTVVATQATSSIVNRSSISRSSDRHVLLSTAMVYVIDAKGEARTCRALLDNGSQSNFVTADLVKRLGLRQYPTCIPIRGVGESETQTRTSVKVSMQSRLNGFKAELACLVLRTITQDIPTVSINRSEIRIPVGIKLADPDFMESSKIDMLIGVETFWDLTCIGQIKATSNQPYWQKTQLGWIAAGGVITRAAHVASTLCSLSICDELNNTMARFWEIEHGARKNEQSPEERRCVEQFESSVRRNSEGRFIVTMPVKSEEMSRLGQSKSTAIRRFENLERKLKRDPALKKEYADFIHDYESLGHMREISVDEEKKWPHYYLPHHCVIKEDSSTTRLRVVFDASCRTTSGISLNKALMVGPILQQDLFSIVSRFRTFAYVLVADITKMYRQVLVDESQTALQRIVWRDHPKDQLKEFELLTLTYGTGPASFLAIKSLMTLAEMGADTFPIGSRIVQRDFYVDDLISGANTRLEAAQVISETTQLLKNGGLKLRKWASNDFTLLENIPEASTTNTIRSLDKEGVFRTLGIQWNPTEDVFQFSVATDVNHSQPVTKRTILSSIAQIFDPLGLLGPVIVVAKIMIQKLWTLQLEWDESLPSEMHTRWLGYKSQLKQLNTIRIPRKVVEAHPFTRVEIHGFCDASQSAYGACVYIRVTDKMGAHRTNLLCSKSRVAPLKAVSLPRLELCGAQLLAQLIDKLISVLGLDVASIFYWTDASVVLGWIKSPSRKFNTFVANRIGEIHELTKVEQWYHVGTHENPADILSRGTNPETLGEDDLWWKGPKWLCREEASWPKTFPSAVNQEELPEQRKAIVVAIACNEELNIFTRFSNYQRLVKTIAICLRFVNNVRREKDNRESGPISAAELETSRKTIVKQVQQASFDEEIKVIRRHQPVGKQSRLLSLNPFIDSEGLLRVGGRLKNSNIAYAARHPLILPSKHQITRLVIEHEHKRLLHAGPQATLGGIRTRYWPLGARHIVRDVVHKCIVCFKAKPRVSQMIMGDLPSQRITPSRPFSSTGVDYCGPIYVREGKRRNATKAKAWISIFVCLATKAVHIELVSDLTTDGFLSALKRFISRRGRPSDIFSDNGTNFVGANRELNDLGELFKREKSRQRIISEVVAENITWHFIPPHAPNFGGLWEAAVRSMKHHFKRIASDSALTFEEAKTLLTQIEAILNSRPLTPLSSDPEDCSFLTPGHFLIGDSLIAYPEPSLQELPINRLSRWQRIEQLRQHFWKRWSLEYLHQMQQRTKWKKSEGPPLKLGQLVIVRENDLPPQSWLRGRIVAVYPGDDGVVRAASVRTSKGIFKRPASKLCILPIET